MSRAPVPPPDTDASQPGYCRATSAAPASAAGKNQSKCSRRLSKSRVATLSESGGLTGFFLKKNLSWPRSERVHFLWICSRITGHRPSTCARPQGRASSLPAPPGCGKLPVQSALSMPPEAARCAPKVRCTPAPGASSHHPAIPLPSYFPPGSNPIAAAVILLVPFPIPPTSMSSGPTPTFRTAPKSLRFCSRHVAYNYHPIRHNRVSQSIHTGNLSNSQPRHPLGQRLPAF